MLFQHPLDNSDWIKKFNNPDCFLYVKWKCSVRSISSEKRVRHIFLNTNHINTYSERLTWTSSHHNVSTHQFQQKIQYSLINRILRGRMPLRSELWEAEAENELLIDHLVTAPVHLHSPFISVSLIFCLLLPLQAAPTTLFVIFFALPLFCSLSLIICVLSSPHFIFAGDNLSLSLSLYLYLAPSLTPSLSTSQSQ